MGVWVLRWCSCCRRGGSPSSASASTSSASASSSSLTGGGPSRGRSTSGLPSVQVETGKREDWVGGWSSGWLVCCRCCGCCGCHSFEDKSFLFCSYFTREGSDFHQ